MKKIIESTFTAIVAMAGLIGGSIWGIKTNWEYEPTILMTISAIQLIAFMILRNMADTSIQPSLIPAVLTNDQENEQVNEQRNEQISDQKNEQTVNLNVSFPQNGAPSSISDATANNSGMQLSRDEVIEIMKGRVQILFIDDDKKFNVVQNLKDGGWKLTKTVEDIKNVDVPIVKKSHILFVDINGVGKLLNLEYEGLDLALMLKQKYADKRIIIYSANKNSNSFHEAWTVCDFRLEKNALPYQFQSLVESYSIELYKKEK